MDAGVRSASAIAAATRAGEISPRETIDLHLERIAQCDDEVGAFITVIAADARGRARVLSESATEAVTGPLAGVPVGIKDLEHMKRGVRHTFGSKLIDDRGFVAPESATVVKRLERAGAIVVGKTNTPEFGHKGITDNEIIGPTVSPVARNLNAGGSSGGSAAAVAAGMVPVALGSDAGGSIRIPASCCHVAGFKPSPGLVPQVSRPNAFGDGVHQSTTGPLARTVADLALVLDVITGHHSRDPESVPVTIDYQSAIGRSVEGMRIGYSPDFDAFPVIDSVRNLTRNAVTSLESVGCHVDEMTVDHGVELESLMDTARTTFGAQMTSAMVGIETVFGIDVRTHSEAVDSTLLDLLELGDDVTMADIARSGAIRTMVDAAIEQVLDSVDILALPTLAIEGQPRDAVSGLEWDAALTWPFNWTGHPVATIPAGLTDNGHPIGLQLVGPRYEDDRVMAIAAALERVRPWASAYPD